MDKTVSGRALRDGLSSDDVAPAGLHPSGFDPSRVVLKVSKGIGWETLKWPQLRAGFEAMRNGKGIDYFENYDVARALAAMAHRRELNEYYIAGRLLQKAQKGGYIRHRGRGQWVRCDTDGSPEGRDAQRHDGEAATAGAEGIAHD